MDLDQLAKLGEFLGGVVVVISVLYLALQARQSAIAQRAENYERTNARASAVLTQLAANPELNKLFLDGLVNFAQLDPYDKNRLFYSNDVYMQHRSGIVEKVSGTPKEKCWPRRLPQKDSKTGGRKRLSIS